MPLYRLEIAPLTILPLNRSPFFSYLYSESLPLGTLVRVPFGRQKIEGVVYGCSPLPQKPPHWMKNIESVVEEAFLTDAQRELAEFISDEYCTPLGRTLKHFLPKIVEERKKDSRPKEKRGAVDKNSRTLILEWQKRGGKPAYVDPSSLKDPKRALIALARTASRKKKQVLILVPELTLIPGWQDACQAFFSETEMAVLHSQLSQGAFFSAWSRVRSGEAKIILSTRQGLFAPFHDLGLIVLTEEQDESYKQWDMSPRYDARRVAAELGDLFSSRHITVTSTPSAELAQAITQKDITPLSHFAWSPPLSHIELVNLRLERFKKNYTPLSEALLHALREALSRNEQALLYVQRQGMSLFSICENCKNVFRCPKSGHSLVAYREGFYRCLSCNYKSGLFPSCPTCGHLGFKNIGIGTEKLEREVERALPGAKVFRADQRTLKNAKDIQSFYEKGRNGTIQILIGTQMILKDPPLPRVSLIAMIDADSLLSFPDYRADERLFQIVSRAAKQVAKSSSRGRILLQTYHPESTFFQRLTGLSADAVYGSILRDREALGYPPFVRLAVLSCQDKKKETAEKRAKALYEKARTFFSKQKAIRLSSPTPPTTLTRGKFFESKIFVRFEPGKELPPMVKRFFRRLGKDIIIDVDPLNLH